MRMWALALALLMLVAAPTGAQAPDAAPFERLEQALATGMGVYWLTMALSAEPPILIMAVERHEPLPGGYPQDRPLWAVSVLITMGSTPDGMQPVTACWGVVVDPIKGNFYGAAGGEIPWLRC